MSAANKRLRIGVIGGGFAGTLHAEGWLATHRAEIVGVASPSAGTRESFTNRFGGSAFSSGEELLDEVEMDAVSLALPTAHHRNLTVAAAEQGVSVVCEKPLAMNLAEADEMISACKKHGVKLMYAEQIIFSPRYWRVSELLRAGSFGDVFQASHRERHGGPHAAWFRDPYLSGGGVTMDMGIHGIGLLQYLFAPSKVQSVFAKISATGKRSSAVDDYCLLVLQFDNGLTATVDASWVAPGGVDDVLEVLGTKGYVRADLARGQALDLYSLIGVDYATEKVEAQTGWLKVSHEEARSWGWLGEFEHFARVLLDGEDLVSGGQQGKAALEVVMAAYQSAAIGEEVLIEKVIDTDRPITPWLERTIGNSG